MSRSITLFHVSLDFNKCSPLTCRSYHKRIRGGKSSRARFFYSRKKQQVKKLQQEDIVSLSSNYDEFCKHSMQSRNVRQNKHNYRRQIEKHRNKSLGNSPNGISHGSHHSISQLSIPARANLFIQGRKAKLNQRERHQNVGNKRNEIIPTLQKLKKQLIESNDYVRITSMVFKKPALEKQTSCTSLAVSKLAGEQGHNELDEKKKGRKEKEEESEGRRRESKEKKKESTERRRESKERNKECKEKKVESKEGKNEIKEKKKESKERRRECKEGNKESKEKKVESKEGKNEIKEKKKESKERRRECKEGNKESKEKKVESKEGKNEIKEKKVESKEGKNEIKEKKRESKERKRERNERKRESKDRKKEDREKKEESKERKKGSKEKNNIELAGKHKAEIEATDDKQKSVAMNEKIFQRRGRQIEIRLASPSTSEASFGCSNQICNSNALESESSKNQIKRVYLVNQQSPFGGAERRSFTVLFPDEAETIPMTKLPNSNPVSPGWLSPVPYPTLDLSLAYFTPEHSPLTSPSPIMDHTCRLKPTFFKK